MERSIRLWPFYCWIHFSVRNVSAQSGYWYDSDDGNWKNKDSKPIGSRNLTQGIVIHCGITWSVKKTYRQNDRNYIADYLIFGDDR